LSISQILREKINPPSYHNYTKIRGQPCPPITRKIRKPNLNKSLGISSTYKSTAYYLYGLMVLTIRLFTSTYMDLFLSINPIWMCVIVPTRTRIHTRLFSLQLVYVRDRSHWNPRICMKNRHGHFCKIGSTRIVSSFCGCLSPPHIRCVYPA
jgi:hypothetical protein